MASNQRDLTVLPNCVRWVSFSIGLALLLLSLCAVANPPFYETIERDTADGSVKTSYTTADLSTPFTVTFITAALLVLYALNGRAITRISAGDFSAESGSSIDNANNFFDKPSDGSEYINVNADGDAPQPTEPSEGVVSTIEGEVAVYDLLDVPAKVIRDAFSKWPDDEPLPDDLQSFEFATRKTGKGNHPWTLKFRGKKPIVVSYGGQGKTGATVTD